MILKYILTLHLNLIFLYIDKLNSLNINDLNKLFQIVKYTAINFVSFCIKSTATAHVRMYEETL